jgi:1,2-diacylglycerol-3-alpha-glucose alpha-1,2-glucosyltransferase
MRRSKKAKIELQPGKLKILCVQEIDVLKWFWKNGTMGGIETNHKMIVAGLRRRGHIVEEKTTLPRGMKPDIIIAPTFGFYSFVKLVLWYVPSYRCAVVVHAHATLEDLKGGFLPRGFDRAASWYLQLFYGQSDIVITPSNHSRKALLALHMRNRPKIVPVSNGIDLERFSFSEEKRSAFRAWLRDQHGVDVSKPIILNVAIMWRRKGIDVFHHVAKMLPQYQFVWVGNFSVNLAVKEQLSDLPNLTFTGFVEDIVAAYCGADVFFFPSYSENQGIPLLEAAACRLPIVCRDLETYDWMENGVHCVKATTAQGFTDAILDLVENVPFRSRIIDGALQKVQEHGFERILDKVETIYKRAIKLHERWKEIAKEKQRRQ